VKQKCSKAMFDEWYAQSSFADPFPSASPKNNAAKPAHERVHAYRLTKLNILD